MESDKDNNPAAQLPNKIDDSKTESQKHEFVPPPPALPQTKLIDVPQSAPVEKKEEFNIKFISDNPNIEVVANPTHVVEQPQTPPTPAPAPVIEKQVVAPTAPIEQQYTAIPPTTPNPTADKMNKHFADKVKNDNLNKRKVFSKLFSSKKNIRNTIIGIFVLISVILIFVVVLPGRCSDNVKADYAEIVSSDNKDLQKKQIPFQLLSSDDSSGKLLYFEDITFTKAEITKIKIGKILTTVLQDFLYNCESVKEVTFTNTKNVTAIGNNFLRGCVSLETVNLGGFTNVSSIGDRFMWNCANLGTITVKNKYNDILDLKPFSGVTTIGDEFMSGCLKIRKIKFNNMKKVVSLGNNFLYNCIALEEVNLTNMTKLNTIGQYFVNMHNNGEINNSQLTSVSMPTSKNLSNAYVGASFLYNCFNLLKFSTGNFPPPSAYAPSDNSFAVEQQNCNSYVVGIKLSGTMVPEIKTLFPNRSNSPFRKFI